jgi:type III secretory pathway lipoprotein EscJ
VKQVLLILAVVALVGCGQPTVTHEEAEKEEAEMRALLNSLEAEKETAEAKATAADGSAAGLPPSITLW